MATALLFPGQGAQYVGMGKDLAEAFPEVADLYARADDLLGVPLSKISWEGPIDRLTRTENAQPAILLHGYAVLQLLPVELHENVVVTAGHSLGEFTAHLAAGTFHFDDALRLVRQRGLLMAASGDKRSGTMAAVLGMEDEAVADLCRQVEHGTVVPANFNAPGQVVISGDVEAVSRAADLARERGARRVVPLSVSGAFHSPLMEEARVGLRRELLRVDMTSPSFPVVANAWGRAVADVEKARESLVEQLTSPVRWTDGLRCMAEFEPDRWLEIGPGSTLAGLLRRTLPGHRATAVGSAEAVEALLALSGSLGRSGFPNPGSG